MPIFEISIRNLRYLVVPLPIGNVNRVRTMVCYFLRCLKHNPSLQ